MLPPRLVFSPSPLAEMAAVISTLVRRDSFVDASKRAAVDATGPMAAVSPGPIGNESPRDGTRNERTGGTNLLCCSPDLGRGLLLSENPHLRARFQIVHRRRDERRKVLAWRGRALSGYRLPSDDLGRGLLLSENPHLRARFQIVHRRRDERRKVLAWRGRALSGYRLPSDEHSRRVAEDCAGSLRSTSRRSVLTNRVRSVAESVSCPRGKTSLRPPCTTYKAVLIVASYPAVFRLRNKDILYRRMVRQVQCSVIAVSVQRGASLCRARLQHQTAAFREPWSSPPSSGLGLLVRPLLPHVQGTLTMPTFTGIADSAVLWWWRP
ncbi:hypothetical protein MRX96_011647 [Rhipicephalus microplus]